MKFLLLFPAFLLAACAGKAPPVVTVPPQPEGRTLDPGQARGVRHAELIKAYPLGRYVDPHNRRVMHEAHTVYRVEATPRWQLATPASSPPGHAQPPPSGSPTRNELMVEINQQRQAARALEQSGEAVSARLAELSDALEQSRALAGQNAALLQQLQAVQARLASLEERMRQPPPSSPATPPAPEDDPW